MRQPTVSAICLTADRQAYTDRAVQCFLSQTYDNSRLLIYDTGKKPYRHENIGSSRLVFIHDGAEMAGTIGKLRNAAHAVTDSEVLIHWDSDDWSAPHRIEEQVRLLQASNADIVGYNDLLFWDSLKSEAWMWRHADHKSPVGTSLCYWRKYWETHPFTGTSAGEDRLFTLGQRTSACTSLQSYGDDPGPTRLMAADAGSGAARRQYARANLGRSVWNGSERPAGIRELRSVMAMGDSYQEGNV
jgi:hypothetical protein